MKLLKTTPYFIVLLLICAKLYSANGVIQVGFGVKAKSMGGVGIALPQDSLIGAMNPAGYGLLENRWDAVLEYLKINAVTEVKGNRLPGGNVRRNARPDVFIPEAGIAYKICPTLTLGLAAYGRGAINSFGGNLGALNGKKKAYAEDLLLYVTPCLAWKPYPCHTIGVGVNCAVAVFKVRGLENLAPSIHPNHVSNKNFDWRPGIGLRIGWIWEALPNLNIGATYETPTVMKKFHKYKGLVPDAGNGNIPENFGVGIGWRFYPCWTLGLDFMRIFWANTRLWGNRATSEHPFGSKHGTGLGWRNQSVYKIGLAWEANPQLTLRVGYNHGTQQIPASQTLANMAIMLVSERQVTCGLTYAINCSSELNICYIHAFKHTTKGRHSIPQALGGGEANFSYQEDWAILGYGCNF